MKFPFNPNSIEKTEDYAETALTDQELATVTGAYCRDYDYDRDDCDEYDYEYEYERVSYNRHHSGHHSNHRRHHCY